MGNEFGHPEWIDFPREGNNWSFKYARRQWSLADNGFLRYEYLYNFDKEMINFVKEFNIVGAPDLQSLWIDDYHKMIAFKKNGLIFLFNFNPTNSFPEFSLPTNEDGKYKVIFNSDYERFGGQSRINEDVIYSTIKLPDRGDSTGIIIYSPSRTALVLKKVSSES
jgi:1,4-alpha-glucan branching enzyme